MHNGLVVGAGGGGLCAGGKDTQVPFSAQKGGISRPKWILWDKWVSVSPTALWMICLIEDVSP